MTKQIDELMALAWLFRKSPYPHGMEDELRTALEAALGQSQSVPASSLKPGEPVGCIVRHRTLQTPARVAFDGANHYGDWSEWSNEPIKYGQAVTHPSRSQLETCQYEMQLVYTAPPAQTKRLDSDESRLPPPPWLTEPQIQWCWNTACHNASKFDQQMTFARAIEAAVRKQFGVND